MMLPLSGRSAKTLLAMFFICACFITTLGQSQGKRININNASTQPIRYIRDQSLTGKGLLRTSYYIDFKGVYLYDVNFDVDPETGLINIILINRETFAKKEMQVSCVGGTYWPVFVNGGDPYGIKSPNCFDSSINRVLHYGLLFSFEPDKPRYVKLHEFQCFQKDSIYYRLDEISDFLLAAHSVKIQQYNSDRQAFIKNVAQCEDAVAVVERLTDFGGALLRSINDRKNELITSFYEQENAPIKEYYGVTAVNKADYIDKLDTFFKYCQIDTSSFAYEPAGYTAGLSFYIDRNGRMENKTGSVFSGYTSGDTAWFRKVHLARLCDQVTDVYFKTSEKKFDNNSVIEQFKLKTNREIKSLNESTVPSFFEPRFQRDIYNHFEALYKDTVARLKVRYDKGKERLVQIHKEMPGVWENALSALDTFRIRVIAAPSKLENYIVRYNTNVEVIDIKAKEKNGEIDIKDQEPEGRLSPAMLDKFMKQLFTEKKKKYQVRLYQVSLNGNMIFEDLQLVQ